MWAYLQLIQCEGSPEPILGISLSGLALSFFVCDLNFTSGSGEMGIYGKDNLGQYY